MDDKKYLVYLHSIGFSQKKLSYIFFQKKNYKEVFETLTYTNLRRLGFFEKPIEKILTNKKKFEEKIIDKKIEEQQVSIVVLWEEWYPKLLKEISEPPYILYIKWVIDDSSCLSVIGSRKISSYGKKVIENIVGEISSYFTIVSGGAYGCDSEAHRITLKNEWKTIIVIGTGIDIIYPSINRELYREVIVNKGAIVSIFPFWEPGNPYNFPIRNELIAWFSLGTLVVEAGERSGTLITAKLALEQGRDVFVIPWEIGKNNSLGCNLLLKKWEAKIVTSSEDILEEYDFIFEKGKDPRDKITDLVHRTLYDFLAYESLFWDEIAKKMNISISELTIHTSFLEIKKIIRKNQEWRYELWK